MDTDAAYAADVSTGVGVMVKGRFNGYIGHFFNDGLAVPVQLE